MFVHWPDYGIRPGMDAEAAYCTAAELLEQMGRDDRHLKWFIENCAEGIATQIKRCEEDYTRGAAFPSMRPLEPGEQRRDRQQDTLDRRERLLTGMRLLGCLHAIISDRLSKSFAAGLGEHLRRTYGAAPPAKKEAGRG